MTIETWICPYDGKEMNPLGRMGHETSKVHKEAVARAEAEPAASAPPIAGDFGDLTGWDSPLTTEPLSEDGLRAEILNLKGILEQAEAARLQAESERDHYKPYAEWPVYFGPEDVIARFGLEKLRHIAEVDLAKTNKDRQKEGRPPIWSENPAFYKKQIDDLIEKTAQEMVAEQTKWLGDDPERMIRMRTVKMVKPDGMMWQVPLDGTINNAAGSLADPVERYKRKGHKLATPVRCLLRECYRPRAERVDGTEAIGGYCSDLHRSVMEGATRDRGESGRVTMLGQMATR